MASSRSGLSLSSPTLNSPNGEIPSKKTSQMFESKDIVKLFANKHVVIIGDSIQRNMYKDIVLLLNHNRLLKKEEMKIKGETSFLGDRIVCRTDNKGPEFFEAREYQTEKHFIQFYFVTRCYNKRVEAILQSFRTSEFPDIVIMNSCLWDISRYGVNSEKDYLEMMSKLMSRLRNVLNQRCMFIWTTTLPIGSKITNTSLQSENVNFLQDNTLRSLIVDNNCKVSQIVTQYGYDVLDLHFYLRSLLSHREADGVHWDGYAHRHITELIIAFLHDSYNMSLNKSVVDRINEGYRNKKSPPPKHLLYELRPQFIQSLESIHKIVNEHPKTKERRSE